VNAFEILQRSYDKLNNELEITKSAVAEAGELVSKLREELNQAYRKHDKLNEIIENLEEKYSRAIVVIQQLAAMLKV
jgi:chromosome segregation ATPase